MPADDAPATPDAPERPARRRDYITPEGMQRLRDELAYLWRDERPRVTKGVADAAAEGDRSENAEYIYGKKRLRQIDRRIRFLSKRIDALTVVEPGARKHPDRVYFGAWVTLEDEAGTEITYRIVGPDEWSLDRGEVSIDSPVARALLGKEVGDEVTVRRPRGPATFEITDVRY